MKTFNRLYIALILFSSSLFAADKLYSFIGIQAANTFVGDSSSPSLGVKYGVQSKQYRTTLSYNYTKDSNRNYQTVVAQIETGILSNTFKNYNFKPYAGFSFGLLEEKNSLSASKDRGYVYGVNTGIAYIFNDALDFDLGYRYLKTSKVKNLNTIDDLILSMHYFY